MSETRRLHRLLRATEPGTVWQLQAGETAERAGPAIHPSTFYVDLRSRHRSPFGYERPDRAVGALLSGIAGGIIFGLAFVYTIAALPL